MVQLHASRQFAWASPVAALHSATWASESREELSLSAREMTVLVVDDEPNIVEVVSAYLQREMFAVVTASTG